MWWDGGKPKGGITIKGKFFYHNKCKQRSAKSKKSNFVTCIFTELLVQCASKYLYQLLIRDLTTQAIINDFWAVIQGDDRWWPDGQVNSSSFPAFTISHNSLLSYSRFSLGSAFFVLRLATQQSNTAWDFTAQSEFATVTLQFDFIIGIPGIETFTTSWKLDR